MTFNERQKVQLCRTKLLKALHALDMDIAIVDACEARYRYFVKTEVMKRSHAILQDLEWHSAELRAHRTATMRIMSYCTWIADLVCPSRFPLAFGKRSSVTDICVWYIAREDPGIPKRRNHAGPQPSTARHRFRPALRGRNHDQTYPANGSRLQNAESPDGHGEPLPPSDVVGGTSLFPLIFLMV